MNEEMLCELLVIKDLYICGRMNKQVSATLTKSKGKRKYKEISEQYINDSVSELIGRSSELNRANLDLVLNSCYMDFDHELFNELMEDYFGEIGSVAFASSYNVYSEDFNNLMLEYCA